MRTGGGGDGGWKRKVYWWELEMHGGRAGGARWNVKGWARILRYCVFCSFIKMFNTCGTHHRPLRFDEGTHDIAPLIATAPSSPLPSDTPVTAPVFLSRSPLVASARNEGTGGFCSSLMGNPKSL